MTEFKPMTGDRRDRWLRSLQVFLYIAFVFLWFKGNIYPLKRIHVSPWIPFVPLVLILGARLVLKIRREGLRLPSLPKKVVWAMLAIALVALAVRVPFLLNSYGLVTSDDATAALAGKHIAQGKLAPICYYGYLYVGSLISHILAAAFKVFGYSVLCFKLVTFLCYLGFILVHFLLLKEVFSLTWAVVISMLYSLPVGGLIIVGFDDTLAAPLVLLLGVSVIYLAFLITQKDRASLIPALGFVMGISFWTHQMTVYFIVVALVMLAVRYRFAWKKYLSLAAFGVVGFLPMLMQEVYFKFHLVSFLSAGERILTWAKVKTTLRLVASLAALGGGWTQKLVLVLALAGFVTLIIVGLRTRKFLPLNIYTLFTLIFFILYFASGHSNRPLTRYIYPLWFCLPVLLLAGFWLLRPWARYAAAAAVVLVLVMFYNLRQNYDYWVAVREIHQNRKAVVAAMEETGQRFWKGEFWTAYQVTALAAERVIVDSWSESCYFPYGLYYDNQSPQDNYIFRGGDTEAGIPGPTALIKTLKVLGVDFKSKKVGDCELVYDAAGSIYPLTLSSPVPSGLPRLTGPEIRASDGYLRVVFHNPSPGEDVTFRLNLEVPGYSTAAKRFSLAESEVAVSIPYPEERSFPLRYYLDYQGIVIPSTVRQLNYDLPAGAPGQGGEDIVLLSGFGSVVKINEARMRVCQKEIKFLVRGKSGLAGRVTVHLYSPFGFSRLYWYGDYAQEVEAASQGKRLLAAKLRDKDNVLRLTLSDPPGPGQTRIITLRFKYHMVFDSAPFVKTAAFLEKIEAE